jgi:hypothetical protein
MKMGIKKWFAITIDQKVQGQGKGSLLLNKLKEQSNLPNGWVIDHNNDRKRNDDLYQSPLQFYIKNDFQIYPELRLEIPALYSLKISWQNECRLL